jgi:hypothetical protein
MELCIRHHTPGKLPRGQQTQKTPHSRGVLRHPSTPWDITECDLGAGNRNRTYDLIITNDALYQLSYSGEEAEF